MVEVSDISYKEAFCSRSHDFRTIRFQDFPFSAKENALWSATYLTQPPEVSSFDLAATHWRLGLVLEEENRKDDARRELQTAASLDPKRI